MTLLRLTMGDHKSNFVLLCIGQPVQKGSVQKHAEQIEVGGHFVSLPGKIYLILTQESGLIFTFHPHKLACRLHFLICDYTEHTSLSVEIFSTVVLLLGTL